MPNASSRETVPATHRLFGRLAAVSLLALCLLFASACTRPPQQIDITGPTMGTSYSVRLVNPVHTQDELRSAIDGRLETVNAQMSTWRPESEISRFNDDRSGEWFPVSADFAAVTEKALSLGRLTDHALDITVLPLVNLWGFGPAFSADALPSEEAIADLLDHVGPDKIEVAADGSALRKRDPDARIDLSAIAKGFGVDAVSELLKSLGYSDFLVEIGGEVRGSGLRADGKPWRVAVEKPQAGERSVQLVIPLRDAAIATSGDYRNFYEIDGRRYAHILDPRTGRPPPNGVASVSVIGADTTTADGLATGLMVMGVEAGLALAEREGLAVLFIRHSGEGFETRASSAFDALLADDGR